MATILNSKYGNNITETICQLNIFDEPGLAKIISDYLLNPFKIYLSDKYNEYFGNSMRVKEINYNFNFEDINSFFTKLEIETGHRHNIIDIRMHNNIINLYYNNNNINITVDFILKEDGLYLLPKNIYSAKWPYSDAYMMINLYLNNIFRDNININSKLYKTDIIFRHCGNNIL